MTNSEVLYITPDNTMPRPLPPNLKKWLYGRGLKQTSLAMVICCSAIWGYIVVHARIARSQCEAEVQSLLRDGLPVYPSDLKRPQVPSNRNAATSYVALTKLLRDKPLNTSQTDAIQKATSTTKLSETDLVDLKNILKERNEESSLIASATSLEACDFQRDYALGPYLAFPEYKAMRLAARLVAAKCAVDIAERRPFESVRRAALIFRMARHAAQGQEIISYFVSKGLDNTALLVLERTLQFDPNDPGLEAAVQKVLRKEWKQESLARPLRGEIVFAKVILDNLKALGPRYAQGPVPQQASALDELETIVARYDPAWTGEIDSFGVHTFHNLHDQYKYADLPYPEACAGFSKVSGKLASGGRGAAMASILLPAFQEVLPIKAKLLAKVRILDAAAEIFLWRQAHGVFPDRLEDVFRPLPVDPFDLKPLRYRREGDGFAIYSIGPSGKFDGRTKDKKLYNQEAIFMYPAPKFLTDSTTPAR